MKEHLRKKLVFNHDDVFDENPRIRLTTQAYETARNPSIQRRSELEAAIIDRYAGDEQPPDATMWHATAVCHLLDGNPELYDDLERMVDLREDDTDYLILALSILAQDERRSEAATSCAERLIETTLRIIPHDEEAVAYARTVNSYHLGWSEEEFNTRLALEKERSRFTR